MLVAIGATVPVNRKHIQQKQRQDDIDRASDMLRGLVASMLARKPR